MLSLEPDIKAVRRPPYSIEILTRKIQRVPMVTFVHVPIVSGSHSIVQLDPAMKLSPGPGAVGIRSPKTRVANTRGTAKEDMLACMR